MFAKYLAVDRWNGTKNEETEIVAPTVHEIEQAIRDLDASVRTLVTVGAGGDVHMAIGGGAGRYLVYATYDNQTFHSLVDLSAGSRGSQLLFVGGQEGDYPGHQVVGMELAIRAARAFAEAGMLDPELHWEVN